MRLRKLPWLFVLWSHHVLAEPPQAPELIARPDLCVTTVARPECKVRVAVSWRATEAADHCVLTAAPGSDRVNSAERRCWSASTSGEMSQQRSITESYEYVLTRQSPAEILARAPVQVLPARSPDRRRNRRRRHVWSVL